MKKILKRKKLRQRGPAPGLADSEVIRMDIGVIAAATFTGANVDERDVCPELVEGLKGVILGDKGFMRPELKNELKEH